MYRVLAVDDDATSLKIAEACLKRCSYKVMAVTHAFQALSLLGGRKNDGESSYDLILADVHMPDMDGFELLKYVNDNFNIPVILVSADEKTDFIFNGLKNGAPSYLFKPLKTDDVKNLWQYSILWKNKQNYACRRCNEASVPRSIFFSSSNKDVEEASKEMKIKKPVWPATLHNRFVEAILILGATNAIPKKILEVMNVPTLGREQVASHLQKFRKFMERVLDGETSLEETSKYWIDVNYYSRIVGGNPNYILLNQLREKRRTGRIAAPIQASLPLPPLNEAGVSSSMNGNNTVFMQNNFSSTVNVAIPTPDLGGVTFQNALNVAAPNYNTTVPQINCHTFQSIVNGEFIRGRNFKFGENNFNNINLQIGNVLFNDSNVASTYSANQHGISRMNVEQIMQPDPNLQNSFDAYQFGNTDQQVLQFGGYVPMPDGSWIINQHNQGKRLWR
ncbi:two-component response regulator ARR14-like isoform X2 [Apium graveolens]|uniref:two-component response regulator ARR14-like isoform X2 n=1 Tax=Apium graveolens TaxID=4045 RepID=UPI003D79AD78